MNLNYTEDNQTKANSDNYYYPVRKSHWEKYQLYYLVFGSFFFTTLIILFSNSSTNKQIRKINDKLSNPQVTNIEKKKNPKSHQKSDKFVFPTKEQSNENWLEETIFQKEVREEFKTWVNSVKYLPRYRIGGQVEPEQHALFYGPPGSGKSYLAEMFAINESSGYIFAKFGTKIYSGSSQEAVDSTMKEARNLLTKNSGSKPVVIIIDEMDSVGVKKMEENGSSVQEVNAILTMIDEIKRDKLNIIVIGITNYPEVLDPALKRAGRLGRQIKVPYLTEEEITKMVNYLEKDIKKEQVDSLKSEENKSQWEKDKENKSFIKWTDDFWSEIHQITQTAFEKCKQAKVGITYTDLEISIKDAIAKEISATSKEITPQSSDFEKELVKKTTAKII